MPILIVIALCFFSFLAGENTYKIIDLHPPGSLHSVATDINDLGQVVGLFNTLEHPEKNHVFLWDKEVGFRDLGETSSDPLINNLGHVVGKKKISKDGWMNFLGDDDYRPFIWRAETGIELLEKPNAPDFFPLSINDHDQILFRNDYSYSKADKVWLWHEGRYEHIKDLKSANHLSNNLIITGITEKALSKYEKLYLPTLYNLANGTTVVIPFTQTRISGGALMSNCKGSVLAFIYDYKKETTERYFWNARKGFKELPKTFIPRWMNNNEEIIGFYKSSTLTELHLMQGDKLINIEKEAQIGYSPQIEFLGIHRDNPIKINERGQIMGAGYLRNSYTKRRAFLIEPLDKKNTTLNLK